MPWTKKDYPDSMKNLPDAVREKSIEIANALLKETDMNEGIAIATAISRAKDWAVNHGKRIESKSAESRTTDVKQHGKDKYVTPREDNRWAIRDEGSNRAEKIFEHKRDAVQQARKEARRANATLTIQKKDGRVQQKISYNPNKRARKQS